MKPSKLLPYVLCMAMLLALPVFVSAQVFDGDLSLTTQAEVDAFHYMEVTGTLSIKIIDTFYEESITSLQSLSSLTKIGNDLGITNYGEPEDLKGLENLISIGGSLRFEGGNVTLNGLDNLTTIGKDIILIERETCVGIGDFSALKNITSIGGSIEINDLGGSFSFKGLEKITSINGHINIVSYKCTGSNDRLSFEGLENLTSIGGWLSITGIPFTNFKGLANLTTIKGNLTIDGSEFKSFEGLDKLTSAGGLYIETHIFFATANRSLLSLHGLENLQSIGDIKILGAQNLNDCCAIADLIAKATGTIEISGGPNCSSIEAIQEDCSLRITSITLVNAVSDQDISELSQFETPEVINLLATGNQLNIRANTFPETVGSVVFQLDGKIIRTENTKPYALFGDSPAGNYQSQMFALGRHTLTATPYEGNNAKKKKGKPLTIEFVVINQPLAVLSFTLVATAYNSDQMEVKEGSKISLEPFDFTGLNIRANPYGQVKSVVFDFVGKKNFRTESVAPFALGGDSPVWNYLDVSQLKKAGVYKLTATPYPMSGGKGKAGMPLTITFEVVENQMAVARTQLATLTKTKVESVEAEDVSAQPSPVQVWAYPNPSEGVIQVQVMGQEDSQYPISLQLYNQWGMKVWEGTEEVNHTAHIDVSHLPSSVYYLKAVGPAYSQMHRIIIR